MATINTKKLAKQGEYGTISMTFGELMAALEKGKVFVRKKQDDEAASQGIIVPKEQREVTDKGIVYEKKRNIFIAHVLIHTFMDNNISKETEEKLKENIGDGVTVEHGTIQFIGISMDQEGNIYLSDGQHRFLHYLYDFFNGTAKIKRDFDFGSDYLNSRMAMVFNAIVPEDGDGPKEGIELSAALFTEEDLDAIRSQRVIAQFVRAIDEEERAALFIAMNTSTNITQANLDKANYGNENMYQVIAELHNKLFSAKKGEPANWSGVRFFDSQETAVLKTLFDANMSTFVPLIAHAALLTYLPKKLIGDKYQWTYSNSQQQADQVRNFFKATHNMSVEECQKLLLKMTEDVLTIGSVMYLDIESEMELVRGCKSLLVGQMNALHKKPTGIKKKDFVFVASNLCNTLKTGYIPAAGGRGKTGTPYNYAYFNNGHRLRSKNELFAKWVAEEYAKIKEAA